MADEHGSARCSGRNARQKRLGESAENNSVVKKRVVLGDLTNLTLSENGSGGMGKTRKRKQTESESKKAVVNRELIVSPGADEPLRLGNASLIYQHLQSLEVDAKRRPLSNYTEIIQNDVKPLMREILIDWLVEVSEEYKLLSDTLYLTVNYIDRYLSVHKVARNKLQLVGIACMLVASKNDEITPPHVEDFCYMTDNSFTKEEVMRMEVEVLKLLEFDMGNPTTKSFLRVITRSAQEKPTFSDCTFDYLCSYLAEMSLLDYDCVRFLPSVVAASAIFLSRLTLQPKVHPWSLVLQHHTGYKAHELKGCVLRLHYLLLRREKSAKALTQKYMDQKFLRVASLIPPSEIPSGFF